MTSTGALTSASYSRNIPLAAGSRHQHDLTPLRIASKPSLRRISKRTTPKHQLCQAVATEERWEGQVRDGRVKNVTSSQIANYLQEGWSLLDVRPPGEVAKVQIKDAIEVPIFIEDPSTSFETFIKKYTAWSMGGWWLGGTHYIPNTKFISQVEAQIPLNPTAKLLVVCQKGLRSLAACEALSRAGYPTIAWLNGGLDATQKGDVITKDGSDIRLAGIGGLSEVLGFTEVQQEYGEGLFSKYQDLVPVVIVVLVGLDVLWLALSLDWEAVRESLASSSASTTTQ